MLRSRGLPLMSVLLLVLGVCDDSFGEEGIVLKRVPQGGGEFGSAAVVVERGDLLHTAQLFPGEGAGAEVAGQVSTILGTLNAILKEAGSDEGSVVRLQINLTDSSKRWEVLAALKQQWGEKAAPALSFVQGKLPRDGALVAIDAVAAVPSSGSESGVVVRKTPAIAGLNGPTGAVLPGKRIMHVAGQAEKGSDVRESTRNTLKHLQQTLEWQKLGWKDAVSIKCFLTPIEAAPQVLEDVRTICGENHPPVIFVEWKSDIPIEIEVVANAAGCPLEFAADETVKYLTPPDMTASPVYSRVAVTNGTSIYVAGLLAQGEAAATSEGETRDLFRQLTEILGKAECGSDLKHLAKATYYCAEETTSRALNAVRPDYYDPARPPAASKAMVPGVGHAERKITLDMIAVRKAVGQ